MFVYSVHVRVYFCPLFISFVFALREKGEKKNMEKINDSYMLTHLWQSVKELRSCLPTLMEVFM